MKKEKLADILRKHDLWLKKEKGGERADLSSANLRSANLRSANLRYADLSSADLSSANLSYADLSYADLSYADLSYADLSSANLSYADLSYANLRSADLRSADLSSANLPSLTVVLLAYWGTLSDETCLSLMRLDASAHDDPKSFELWASGGECPYSGRRFQRVANFAERSGCYTPGPAPTIYEAAMMVLKEKTKGWEPK